MSRGASTCPRRALAAALCTAQLGPSYGPRRIQAYGSIFYGNMEQINLPPIKAIAETHGKTPAQVRLPPLATAAAIADTAPA